MKGIIIFKQANEKSKSEGLFPFLYLGNGEFVKIHVEEDNPFENETLKKYDCQKVEIEGELNDNGTFVIEDEENIRILEEQMQKEEP